MPLMVSTAGLVGADVRIDESRYQGRAALWQQLQELAGREQVGLQVLTAVTVAAALRRSVPEAVYSEAAEGASSREAVEDEQWLRRLWRWMQQERVQPHEVFEGWALLPSEESGGLCMRIGHGQTQWRAWGYKTAVHRTLISAGVEVLLGAEWLREFEALLEGCTFAAGASGLVACLEREARKAGGYAKLRDRLSAELSAAADRLALAEAVEGRVDNEGVLQWLPVFSCVGQAATAFEHKLPPLAAPELMAALQQHGSSHVAHVLDAPGGAVQRLASRLEMERATWAELMTQIVPQLGELSQALALQVLDAWASLEVPEACQEALLRTEFVETIDNSARRAKNAHFYFDLSKYQVRVIRSRCCSPQKRRPKNDRLTLLCSPRRIAGTVARAEVTAATAEANSPVGTVVWHQRSLPRKPVHEGDAHAGVTIAHHHDARRAERCDASN